MCARSLVEICSGIHHGWGTVLGSEIMIKHIVHQLQDEDRDVTILGVPMPYECYAGSRCFVTMHFGVWEIMSTNQEMLQDVASSV